MWSVVILMWFFWTKNEMWKLLITLNQCFLTNVWLQNRVLVKAIQVQDGPVDLEGIGAERPVDQSADSALQTACTEVPLVTFGSGEYLKLSENTMKILLPNCISAWGRTFFINLNHGSAAYWTQMQAWEPCCLRCRDVRRFHSSTNWSRCCLFWKMVSSLRLC